MRGTDCSNIRCSAATRTARPPAAGLTVYIHAYTTVHRSGRWKRSRHVAHMYVHVHVNHRDGFIRGAAVTFCFSNHLKYPPTGTKQTIMATTRVAGEEPRGALARRAPTAPLGGLGELGRRPGFRVHAERRLTTLPRKFSVTMPRHGSTPTAHPVHPSLHPEKGKCCERWDR